MSDDTCDHGKLMTEPCFFCSRGRTAPRPWPIEHRNPRPAEDRKRRGITISRKRRGAEAPK